MKRNRPRRCIPHIRITVVSGSPGAGKTTWVKQQQSATSLVWDMDAVCEALGIGEWPRPIWAAKMLQNWRQDLLERLAVQVTGITEVYIIIASVEHAARVAHEMTATHVHLSDCCAQVLSTADMHKK